MKTLKIGIASYKEMKARSMSIAAGKYKPSKDEPDVWFPSTESFARILSEKNRSLLDLIAEFSFKSLTELAEKSGREKSNLSRTLKTMENYRLVTLDRIGHGRVVPRVTYDKIALTMPIKQLHS